MIHTIRGELIEVAADALLRPVSAEWDAVTPAMRRLELAAGPALQEQCRRLGELPVGSAVITEGGALAARFVVHAVVRSLDEPVSGPGVERALRNGLRRLQEWGIDDVALPPLGTGAGNLDAEDAARLMVDVIQEHTATAEHPRRFTIVVESEYEEQAFARQLARLALPLLDDAGAEGLPPGSGPGI
ncbi:MAG TPA: macro domain-containing protein [Longimicrobiales bacterium]|nr:macro domain-containing protein [Longimicrobiales bacterium]